MRPPPGVGAPRPGRPPPPPPGGVDIDNYWGAPIGAAALAIGTALAVGAIVSTLPPGCRTIEVFGETYRQCGDVYYLPRYDGATVVYEVVPSPYR